MIAIDIGNTNLHFAWQKNNRIIKTVTLPTKDASQESINAIVRDRDEELIICSVVPKITKLFKKLRGRVYIIGQDLQIPINCFYDRKKVGMDRLVVAFAAKTFFSGVRIIIDFGTAITFDILSKQGDYEGGLILPGIGSTLKILSGCALLPKKIEIKKVTGLIPKHTSASISKGVKEGFSAMINGLVKKYRKSMKLSNKETIIITGGDARYILPKLNFSYIYAQDLVIEGIFILGQKLILSE
jgi:type III pantothenate kinase